MLRKIVKNVTERSFRGSRRWFSKKRTFSPKNLQGRLGILGVPFGKGQKRTGNVEGGLMQAPDQLRKTGFVQKLECLGINVCDYGNIQYEPDLSIEHENMHNLNHFVPCIKEVSKSVMKILKDSRKCLVLGGDHSVATGSIYGHMKLVGPSEIALVYVDAHADINTNLTSPSGNLHGMTVAFLAEELQREWSECGVPGLDWLAPCLPLKSVAYIGVRSIDPGEANFLASNHVAVFSMEEVGKCGIHEVLTQALHRVDPRNTKSIHLSFDIDALDVFEAPSVTVPERGGLLLREGIEIAEILHRTGRLSVVDFVEVNPGIGNDIQKQTTLDAAKLVLLGMFGNQRRGNPKR